VLLPCSSDPNRRDGGEMHRFYVSLSARELHASSFRWKSSRLTTWAPHSSVADKTCATIGVCNTRSAIPTNPQILRSHSLSHNRSGADDWESILIYSASGIDPSIRTQRKPLAHATLSVTRTNPDQLASKDDLIRAATHTWSSSSLLSAACTAP